MNIYNFEIGSKRNEYFIRIRDRKMKIELLFIFDVKRNKFTLYAGNVM